MHRGYKYNGHKYNGPGCQHPGPRGKNDAQRIAIGLIIDWTDPWYLFWPSTNMNS